eukprot:scaffold29147_cov63-Phaeocystis_antarctica.AAC.4
MYHGCCVMCLCCAVRAALPHRPYTRLGLRCNARRGYTVPAYRCAVSVRLGAQTTAAISDGTDRFMRKTCRSMKGVFKTAREFANVSG